MKKIFVVLAVSSIGLMSCKKTHTCECTDNSTLTMTKQTKRSAQKSCDNLEESSKIVTPGTTCTLTSK